MLGLLTALWRNQDLSGDVTFWFTKGTHNKLSHHVPLKDVLRLTNADQAELGEMVGPANVYYGLGLRRHGLGANQQGGKKDIIALPAIPLDIDFYNPKAHKATNLPKDLDEAAEVLLVDEPAPSIIVGTGNGAHLYWLLREVLLMNTPEQRVAVHRAIQSFQSRIQKRAKDHGWQLDKTSQIQRVWRVPGFVNQKTGNPVELWHCDIDTDYSLDDLGVKAKGAKTIVDQALRSDTKTKIPKYETNFELDALRKHLQQTPSDHQLHQAIQAVLKGESFAVPGERDDTLYAICAVITWSHLGRKADPKKLAELFRPSLSVWASEEREDGKTLSLEEEMEKAVGKLTDNQMLYWKRQKELRPSYEGMARALGVTLDAADEKGDGSNDFFRRKGVLVFQNVYYVFDFRQGYFSSLRTEKEMVPFLRDAWVEAPKDMDIHYTTAKGQTKTKALAQLTEEYGTVVEKVVGNLHEEHNHFIDGVFLEAVAKKRVTTPEFNEEIDQWMQLFAGDRYGLLRDWVAVVTQLEDTNSCLYLDGVSGAGKSMLAKGLARIWCKGSPTDFLDVVGPFNTDIVECPLVWIDEGLTGHKNLTEQVRRLVAQHSFVLREKFKPSRRVQGAVRLMICANNDEVLSDPNLSSNDEEAMIKRILYIYAHREAERFIAERGGPNYTRAWVEGDGLARHALWLAENHKVKRGERFLVEGESSEMHKKMLIQGDTNGLIYEWITKFASNPGAVQKRWRSEHSPELARIGNDEILVNTQGLLDCWDVYMKDVDKPTSGRAGRIIKKVSEGRVRPGSGKVRPWFHKVNAEMILAWCDSNQIGNQDQIEENLKGEIDE